jgi:tetratricopeptide (TPR) repeat protein
MNKPTANKQQDWRADIRDELRQFLVDAGANPERELTRVVTLNDELFLHGQYACSQNLVDKAIRSFKELARLSPGAWTPHCALGRIYMTQGNIVKAEKSTRRAHELNPADFKTKVTLLYLLNRLGKDASSAQKLRLMLRENVLAYANRLGLSLGADIGLWDPGTHAKPWLRGDNESARHSFSTGRYTVLRAVLPGPCLQLLLAEQKDLLGRRAMIAEPSMNRMALTDPPMAVLINYHLAALTSVITGANVVPTYAFAIHYLPGGNIQPHRDRPQNELSMSLHLSITAIVGF